MIKKCVQTVIYVFKYDTDLTQYHTREWYALESNPLSAKISSIHHRVQVDALMKLCERNTCNRHLQNN